jgi:putative YpdA family bacillithiol system oxidoreductase
MESLYTALIFVLLLLTVGVPYWLKTIRMQKEAVRAHEKSSKAGLLEPVTLHPRIDLLKCIGCGSCVQICPEEVLGIVDGRAAVVNGVRCIGHTLCAEVCPVGAITMTFGSPRQGLEIPYYDEHYRTNIEGLYIVGELGGIGLIKNAIEQGGKAVAHIASRPRRAVDRTVDVAIVGAGPAGVGAALSASASGLTHILLEQDDLGGSILHYPRQKLVLTSPVELPLYGKLTHSEISKEELLGMFISIVREYNLQLRTGEKVESITQEGNLFRLTTRSGSYRAAHVILALGRRGTPRKLNIPGEGLPKVYYRLIEAERYTGRHLLVIGGGDSAVEAAAGLASQKGNTVTLSYRRSEFVRLKERNEAHIKTLMNKKSVRVVFNSEVTRIEPDRAILKELSGVEETLANDFVFIFAGGELPAEFLNRIGVKLRTEEITV